MPETASSKEEVFVEALQEVLTIAEKLGNYCETVEELKGMVRLAIENGAQLRLLLSIVSQQPSKR